MSRIEVQVSGDASRFKSALSEARNAANAFGQGLKGAIVGGGIAGAAAAIVSEIINVGKEAMRSAMQIGDLAERFNVSSSALQKFGFMASQSGSSMEAMAKGIGKLRMAMSDAGQKAGDLRDMFAAMGMSAEDLRNGSVSVEDAMMRVADAVAGTSDETEKLTIASAVFGDKLANELLPTLNLGSQGMKKLGESAGVMSKSAVDNLKWLGDGLDKVGSKFKSTAGNIAGSFVGMYRGVFGGGEEGGTPSAAPSGNVGDLLRAREAAKALAEEQKRQAEEVAKIEKDAEDLQAKEEQERRAEALDYMRLLEAAEKRNAEMRYEAENRSLTNEELLNKKYREREDIIASIATERDALSKAQMQGEVMGLDKEIQDLQNQIAAEDEKKKKPSLGKFSNQADQLQAVGLFAGGSAISYSRSMDENTRKTAENTARIARAVEGKQTTSPTVYAP